jgi:hypothetical protein
VRRESSSAADHRSEGRSNVFLAATLITGESPVAVHIRNLSTHGVLIEGVPLPKVGARVRLLRGQLSALGQVAWEGTGQAGIQLDCEIDVDKWVRRIGHSGQQRVDAVISAVRSGGPVGGDLRPPRTESLMAISTALDQVCARLAALAGMSVPVAEEVLRLDAIARSLRELASRPKV